MSKLLLGSLTLALLAMPARAAVLHEVFLADGPDGVPDAVEIDQINTHSELTLLVLNAAGEGGAWGEVENGFTIFTGEVGDNRVLLSDGAFPTDYGAIADPGGTLPIVDISGSGGGSAAVTELMHASTAYTGGLDLSKARLLVLLQGRLSQNVGESQLHQSDFNTQEKTLTLGDGRSVELLDWWGYDAKSPPLFEIPGVDLPVGLDPDGNELVDVRGSSVLIRDPETLDFVHGNSDGEGHLAGTSPLIRITPGVSNPLFAEASSGGELIPEPTAAALVVLGVGVVLLRRPMRLSV